MNIAIIGTSKFGKIINKYLKQVKYANLFDNIYRFDKYNPKYRNPTTIKGIKKLLQCDYAFLVVPTPFDESRQQFSKREIHEMCHLFSDISYGGCIIISSVVEPETTEDLVKQYTSLRFVHNPDFFTDDLSKPTQIVIGFPSFATDRTMNKMKNLWHVLEPNIPQTICTSLESELVRMCVNTCHGLKVQNIPEIYCICQRLDINYVCKYASVQMIMLSIQKTTYGLRTDINFDDDVKAFNAYLEKKKIYRY